MVMINEQWADALDPVVRMAFMSAFARRPRLAPALFNTQTSSNSDEELSGIGAIGIDAWDQYEKSGKAGQADFDKAYKTTFVHKEFVLEIPIERKLYDDAKWAQIRNPFEAIADSAAQKRETDAASVFNNSESASYLGGDGVALLSNSHPLSPAKAGSTQDNLLTLALTKDNLASARQTMMAFTDDTGGLLGITPNLLLVPPELEDTAIEITQSMHDPNSANNTVNSQFGRFGVITWHYLTDANKWYLIDTNLMSRSLFWFDRAPLNITPKIEDKTLRATWIAYQRYSYGWIDWRWLVGSNPS